MASTVIPVGEWAGFKIALEQSGPDSFILRYGQQLDCGLSYEDAAARLGEAIMHALASEGKLDDGERENKFLWRAGFKGG